ncbi:NAD(P)H oxidoreductase [Streptomyces sp. AP-93]|uniref:NAD(P)H oxidoreductase n=1 Tax=Streptomyces sp. AP-93 TaxID=2929048 RepID=UPI001FAFCF45|nr:NAD(P)H oxidoreductase [Streptomyces sp. AP-93]MCJ0873564.1 NAD(P)H oxidoreductase [Streptomyces sp. AP-93]
MSAALVVLAHPRGDSLTAQLARRAVARLEADGHTVDVLDLHAEGFDPRMGAEDEPDWSDPDKEYSAETRAHMDRIAAAEILVVVFPLWWFGLPAILKGWIDRVWNNGFAYGRSHPLLKGKRMVWIPLVSYPEAKFKELGWDEPVDRLLRVGISQYCGIEEAVVHFVYDSLSAGASALAEADAALAPQLESRAHL